MHLASPHSCPLKTLQKCEIALEKLKNDMAVVSGALWPDGVPRAAGILGRSGHTCLVTQNHRLGGIFTVQGGQKGLTTPLGDPAQRLLPGLPAVGGREMEEISLHPWAVGFPSSCLHLPSPGWGTWGECVQD